eukprot:4353132-Amphidinium_carterae.1
MDPNQRVPLEVAYECLWRGGHTRSSIDGRNIGVFVGDTGSDWQPVADAAFALVNPSNNRFIASGRGQNITASRLSFAFNLRGPISTTDTACSSSLVATSLAMLTLRARPDTEAKEMEPSLNRMEEGVAYGICTLVGIGSYFAMTGIGALSPQGRYGRSKSVDHRLAPATVRKQKRKRAHASTDMKTCIQRCGALPTVVAISLFYV